MKRISEVEFHQANVPVLFNGASSRCFGIVSKKNSDTAVFKFGWQSDLIMPTVTEIESEKVSIGIDQDWVLVDLVKSSVLLQLRLMYNFLETYVFRHDILIATELELIRIDRKTSSVLQTYPLPEYFQEIVIKENIIEVKLAEQASIEIPLVVN